jgi:hypothetical protein
VVFLVLIKKPRGGNAPVAAEITGSDLAEDRRITTRQFNATRFAEGLLRSQELVENVYHITAPSFRKIFINKRYYTNNFQKGQL